MENIDCRVERVKDYSPEIAAGIGRLMPFLNEKFSDQPMAEELLKRIIESPNHLQLVARIDGIVVGSATLSIILGPGVDKEGYLSDFVTDPEYRGRGVGGKIWEEIMNWCREQEIGLAFTSNPKRQDAHRFYLDHGAKVRDTTVFNVDSGK